MNLRTEVEFEITAGNGDKSQLLRVAGRVWRGLLAFALTLGMTGPAGAQPAAGQTPAPGLSQPAVTTTNAPAGGGMRPGRPGSMRAPAAPRNPAPILPALPAPHDTSFYASNDVPHGRVEEAHYNTSAGADKRMHVYLPPGYDADAGKRYPVLYLNHGGGENDTHWSAASQASGEVL